MALEPSTAIRILFAAGITNIAFLLLVLFSCRCMGATPLIRKAFGSKAFQKFYRFHCYYWWAFIASVLVHTAMAFYIFGNPF